MAIKVIVELQAKPGMRDELKSLLEGMVAEHGPGQEGFLGSERRPVQGDGDQAVTLIESGFSRPHCARVAGARARIGFSPHPDRRQVGRASGTRRVDDLHNGASGMTGVVRAGHGVELHAGW